MSKRIHNRVGWRSSPLGELLGGGAFRHHPEDASLPLAKRFSGEVVLLVIVARDRAACLRVGFSPSGPAVAGTPTQIVFRQAGDLSAALKAEAEASGASWVVFSIGTGWQAQVCSRSARGFSEMDPFEGHRLLREQPELVLPKPQADFLYAMVDHPWLERSVVFGIRRREVESLIAEALGAGLGVAAVKIGVACLLEQTLASDGEGLLDRDLLVSDGLSVLLLKIKDGDFARDLAGEAQGVPRQASNRPNDLGQDLLRFVKDSGGRSLQLVVPPELLDSVRGAVADQSLVVRPGVSSLFDDPSKAVLTGSVRHELLLTLSRQRAALPAGFRPVLNLALAVSALGLFLFAGLIIMAEQESAVSLAQQVRLQASQARLDASLARLQSFEKDQRKAEKLVKWLSCQPHAQALLLRLLSSFPESVTLERLAFQMEDGGRQLVLECHLSGVETAQAVAVRSLEQAVAALGYRIGERPPPVVVQRGLQYRWRLIMPVREEGRRS